MSSSVCERFFFIRDGGGVAAKMHSLGLRGSMHPRILSVPFFRTGEKVLQRPPEVSEGSSSTELTLMYSARELPSKPVVPCCRLGTLLQSCDAEEVNRGADGVAEV